MNARNYIGCALFGLIFVASFMTTDGARAFVNGIGLAIVLSGMLGATLLSYPWDNLQAAVRVGWNSYTVRPPTTQEVVQALTEFSVQSRQDGILSLQQFEKRATASFLRGALEMMVDGYAREELRDILTTELAFFRQRRQLHERVFRHMARLAPAFGVAGSVIGLMGMLLGIGETAVILRTIPLALTSTLYGIVIANFILIPVAEAIHFRTMQELLVNRLVIDGVMAIMAEQNSYKLEKKLESFLAPACRGSNQHSLEEIRRRYAELRAREQTVEAGWRSPHMRTATRLVIAFLLSLVVLASPPLAADEETVDLMTDDGRLDRSWFGAVAPEFHRCEEERCELDGDEVAYDYLWVRPGFSLEGRTLHLAPWEPGAFRGEAQRDSDEIENGEKITERAADKLLKPLRKAYKKLATVSTEEGDWIVTGRVVDSLRVRRARRRSGRATIDGYRRDDLPGRRTWPRRPGSTRAWSRPPVRA